MPPRSARLGSRANATFVVDPTGEHKATIVWLHSLNEDGSIWKSHLEQLNLPNIKWICPTAPTRPIPGVAGFDATTWFDYDMGVVATEESPYDDLGGLDASAALVANLLSNEPAGIKLGVGGIGVGAAVALHSATCFARGRYHNGSAYPPINFTAILALNGWLPRASRMRNLIRPSRNRAASLPIFLAHGLADVFVHRTQMDRAQQSLSSSGFQFRFYQTYEGFDLFAVKLGVGGLGMGATVALYSAICSARGRYNTGDAYPNISLTAVLGLNGWLPQASIRPSRNPAAFLPDVPSSRTFDNIVHPRHSHRVNHSLSSSAFQSITYQTYGWIAHFLAPDEREDIRNWLNGVMNF